MGNGDAEIGIQQTEMGNRDGEIGIQQTEMGNRGWEMEYNIRKSEIVDGKWECNKRKSSAGRQVSIDN